VTTRIEGEGVTVELRRIERAYREYAVSFPSPIVTPQPQNNRVHLAYFTPPGSCPARPAVLVLHSLGVTHADTERALCAHLAGRGIAAALLTLPYHMERRPPGTRPANLLLEPDPQRMVDFLEQASADVDAARRWLEGQVEIDERRIGIVGISLGAVVGSLQLARDDRFRAGVLVLGGGDMAHILTKGAITFFARGRYRKQGLTREVLREALAPVEPLTYARPLSSSRRLLMINARYDLLIPRQDTLKLWEAFGRPPLLWLDTGHYGPGLISDDLNAVIGDFLVAALDGRSWHAPREIPAITLRVGLLTGYAPILAPVVMLDLGRLCRYPDLRLGAGLRPFGLLLGLSYGICTGLDATVATDLFRGPVHPRAFLFWHVVL
jgi:dienelactone hydrolase